jgi:predicted nuclease of predicted toxin-antitoxin system
MRFLADESCDFAVVRALRACGHEVRAVAEDAPKTEDAVIIEIAARERRVLITEDKDFGQLVYRGFHASSGVVLIRFPTSARQGLPASVVAAVRELGDRITGSFAILEPGRLRIGRSPGR